MEVVAGTDNRPLPGGGMAVQSRWMPSARQNQTESRAAADWLLVVDDEEPIRGLIASALGSDALEVVTAADARTALQALDRRGTEPLMVILDVLMPGVDGLTLARKLTARLSRSKIIVMSGHLTADSYWPADLREITFLAKPFRMAVLADLVAAARAESPGRS
jgi:two-component system cell cycle sensor histidine kinase/response regulator CckA